MPILSSQKNQIHRYRWGNPIHTDALASPWEESETPITLGGGTDLPGLPDFVIKETGEGWELIFTLEPRQIIWGLAEQMGPINKRGRRITLYNSDVFQHVPEKRSLYGSHAFVMIFSPQGGYSFYLDHPGQTDWDLGFSKPDELTIQVPGVGFDLYAFQGQSPKEWVPQYIGLTGRPYLPPRWAFGYHQSRWGYGSAEDLLRVADTFDEKDLPLDMIALDIDYMDHFKVFTADKKKFPELKKTLTTLKERGIRVIPIIDPGVKVEKGYEVYESGLQGKHFILNEKGEPFLGQVWPGWTHFPDFQQSRTRTWWGNLYQEFLEAGFEGFWNDMNEPAIFFTPEGVDWLGEQYKLFQERQDQGVENFFTMMMAGAGVSNAIKDYQRMHQRMDDGRDITLHEIHNLYGHNMSRATREGLDTHLPNKRSLLFSRANFAGGQRYGGVWTGDNKSWWEHIALNLHMIAGLQMSGWFYSGADLGGFGDDCYGEILIRWTQFGLFMPLMRNHSALGTREQEPYALDRETLERSRSLLKFRYKLLPYLYSEFLRSRESCHPLLRPIGYDYNDQRSLRTEDQILWGEGIMLAPVMEPNALGRVVYFPEDDFCEFRFDAEGKVVLSTHHKGDQYVSISQDELVFFAKPNTILALGPGGKNSQEAQAETLYLFGRLRECMTFEYLEDDGETPSQYKPAISRLKLTLAPNAQGLELKGTLEDTAGLCSVKNINYTILDPQGNLLQKEIPLSQIL
jgi:alpha-glucosidase